jgi:hypothetical protein
MSCINIGLSLETDIVWAHGTVRHGWRIDEVQWHHVVCRPCQDEQIDNCSGASKSES